MKIVILLVIILCAEYFMLKLGFCYLVNDTIDFCAIIKGDCLFLASLIVVCTSIGYCLYRFVCSIKKRPFTTAPEPFDKIVNAIYNLGASNSPETVFEAIDECYKDGGPLDIKDKSSKRILLTERAIALRNYLDSEIGRSYFMGLLLSVFCGGIISGIIANVGIDLFTNEENTRRDVVIIVFLGFLLFAILLPEAIRSIKGCSDIYTEFARYELNSIEYKLSQYHSDFTSQEPVSDNRSDCKPKVVHVHKTFVNIRNIIP